MTNATTNKGWDMSGTDAELLQEMTLHISHISGLSVGTVAELLANGWEYTDSLKEPGRWVETRTPLDLRISKGAAK